MRLIDKEEHLSDEKKNAEEDKIRKVESERPLEGETKFQISGKRKAGTQTFQWKWLTSHYQVEGSGNKSESLNYANHSQGSQSTSNIWSPKDYMTSKKWSPNHFFLSPVFALGL